VWRRCVSDSRGIGVGLTAMATGWLANRKRGARTVKKWMPGALCRVCGRVVAEGAAWRDAEETCWDAHWDCHERADARRGARDAGPSTSERSLQGRIGAYTRWAHASTEDRYLATRPMREGLQAKFEREADPEGTLPPWERAKRAESLRKAFYARLALKSAQARRRRKNLRGDT